MHGCQRNMSLELDLNSQLCLSMPNVIAIKLNISSWCFYIVQQYHSFLNTETLLLVPSTIALHCCKSWNNSTVWSKGVLTQSAKVLKNFTKYSIAFCHVQHIMSQILSIDKVNLYKTHPIKWWQLSCLII